MDMEGIRSSTAALLFLTLVLAASGGDYAAAVERCDPHPDEPCSYRLVAFQNKDGEEIRLLADDKSERVSGYANRSGHWFYTVRRESAGKQRVLPTSDSWPRGRRADGLWNTLGVLVSDPAPAAEADPERYMLAGMRTSGGDKKRLVVDQRYMSITGFAMGFSSRPGWFFRPRRRLFPSGDGPRGGPEEVASKLVAAMLNCSSSACAREC